MRWSQATYWLKIANFTSVTVTLLPGAAKTRLKLWMEAVRISKFNWRSGAPDSRTC